MSGLTRITGLREIAHDFDAVLLDQFGVLHDGRRAFDGAAEAVAGLRAMGKRVAVLSNSGKRAAENARRLAALGFRAAWFDAVTTSGELCRGVLADMLASGALPPGAPVLALSRGAEGAPSDGLCLRTVGPGQEAALVLIAGAEPERRTLADYAEMLRPYARRGAPCLCANPDLRMYVEGGAAFGPGAVARAYEAMGGTVRWIGKPHAEIFAAALSALGVTAPARALMIGDSLEHDIAGAAGAGCGWLWVEGGVQGDGGTGEAAPLGGHVIDRLRW